ncbi:hypothetical protein D3C76_1123390 [compost metagenome]
MVSSRKARLMVMRLTPNKFSNSLSDGTLELGNQAPERIFCMMICLTLAYSGEGLSSEKDSRDALSSIDLATLIPELKKCPD